jgi:hypothetical protein
MDWRAFTSVLLTMIAMSSLHSGQRPHAIPAWGIAPQEPCWALPGLGWRCAVGAEDGRTIQIARDAGRILAGQRPYVLRANGPMPSQPGASPHETIRKSHQGPSARPIMPHAGISAAFLIGRAVGAEYRFESIPRGDAPGWDDAVALPLKSHVGPCPGWDGGAPLARKMGEQSKSRVMRADSCGPTALCLAGQRPYAIPAWGIAPGNHPQKPPRAIGPTHHAARRDIRRIPDRPRRWR